MMVNGSIRAFIAIELPPDIQKNLNQVVLNLRDQMTWIPVRWVSVGNIHLTLKFLGDVSLSQVELIEQLLNTITLAHDTFKISVGGVGVFPRPQRPRVIWAGVDAPPDLVAIQEEIESTTAQVGYIPESRPFSPHLTLGRISQLVNTSQANRIAESLAASKVSSLGNVEVKAVHLIRSELKPTGAVYTRLFSGLLNEIKT